MSFRPADMRQPSTIAEPVRLGSRPGFIPPRVRPRSLLLGARDSHWHGAARPTAPISRQPPERHCRRFSGGLSPIYAEGLWQLMPSARPRHFIPAGINAGGPAGRAPEPGIASRPRRAPARAARTPWRSLENIAGNMQDTIGISGHDCPSCPIGGFGYAREHGTYRTGAGARNARRRETVTGAED
jgi:hypothetical protein